MVFLLSTLTQLLVAGTLVLAAVLGSAVAYFYVQARRRETFEAEREAHAVHQRDAELAHIRQRLEEIYERQQTGTQTQFARVDQELEALQTHLDSKGRQIDGVQGQLRYELQRHEEEIAALRNQLREAVEVFAAAALPAARTTAPALGAAPEAEPAKPKAAETTPPKPEPPAFTPLKELVRNDAELLDDMFGGTDLDSDSEMDEQPAAVPHPRDTMKDDRATENDRRGFTAHSIVDVSEQIETNDDFEFVDFAEPEPSTPSSEPTPPPTVQWSRLDETYAEHDDTDAFGETDEPAGDDEPEPHLPTHSGDGMGDADAFAATTSPLRRAYASDPRTFEALNLDSDTPDAAEPDAAEPDADLTSKAFDPAELVSFEEPEPEPEPAAHDHDDLTALSAVDEEMQQKLYALGITTIEAIARWSRADARRIVSQLTHTSEEDIMDRWVFEAQAILFERYQAELHAQRQQHIASAG